MKQVSKQETFAFFIASVCYIGKIKIAPGTWGSIPGMFLGAALYTLPLYLKLLIFAVITLIALWSIHQAEKQLVSHDDKTIVIDEVLGQAIVTAFIEPTLVHLILSFVLFRLFDISKIGPIGWIDQNVSGSSGTLFDDVFAGILALVSAFIITSML